jgi:urease accessory protein
VTATVGTDHPAGRVAGPDNPAGRVAGPDRQDPAWYSPSQLPAEFAALDAAVQGGLGVGAAGKVGLLELALAPSGGRTRVQRQYQRAPLYLYRPIYLDGARPEMAFLYVQQSGDGLVQGDRYRIDIDCAPGTAAHVTTQAPTKVFLARQNFATQLVNLTVGAGAVLEYLPDPVVPCRGSRLFQRTCLTAAPDATVIMGETLLPGRVAHGESHAYDRYWAETEIRRPDAAGPLCADVLRLSPAGGAHPRSIGLLGGHDVVGTLHVVTARLTPPALVTLLRHALADCPDVLAGVSELPGGAGASARLLGPTGRAVQAAMRAGWHAARLALLGAPAPDLRKG